MSQSVWRFGYGSNISLSNLIKKKKLQPTQHLTGYCKGWQLSFGLPGLPYVDPAFASVREAPEEEVHGAAFAISLEEAERLDRQEGGYDVVPVAFVAYDGTEVPNVGLYVPKAGRENLGHNGLPSLRYLRLIQQGAREAGLAPAYLQKLESMAHYVTPGPIRAHTLATLDAFDNTHGANALLWTAEELSAYNGSHPDKPAHTSVLGYVIKVQAYFSSWRGHTITRRNILHFNGESVDANDIRAGSPGFFPLPCVGQCNEEEREFLYQNLDHLLQLGGVVVGRLKEFIDSQALAQTT